MKFVIKKIFNKIFVDKNLLLTDEEANNTLQTLQAQTGIHINNPQPCSPSSLVFSQIYTAGRKSTLIL